MPNFDGGHYFLTALIPVRTDVLVTEAGCICSPVSAIYGALSTLPTALQSRVTEKIGINSPFSRNRRTHFARFGLINNVVYNGRTPVDAIKVAINQGEPNPLAAQAVDILSCPFLMFTADFDAKSGDESELRSWLDELWVTMQEELKAIFTPCLGYDKVTDSRSFQDYIIRCQIETTMPFNDYWITPPPFPSLSLTPLAAPAAIALVVTLAAVVMWFMGTGDWPWGKIAGFGVLAIVAAIAWAYLKIMRCGHRPFPTAPNADLPSVLKSIYLQQKFTDFALETQGADPAKLHELFGLFLAQHQPGNLQTPTQLPGVIKS